MTVSSEHVHQLTGVEDVQGFVTRVCFKTGPPGTVGIESEWFVVDPANRHRHVPIPELERALHGTSLPRGSLVTYEPGGQLELSSAPAPNISAVRRNLEIDLEAARALLDSAGLLLLGCGSDPHRPPKIQAIGPRYTAMHQFFAHRGSAGEAMMGSTAAIQICLDAGRDEAHVRRRWRVANALLPILLAAFANSPLRLGRPTGFRSSRYAVWAAIDPGRTTVPEGPDPAEAWARYALAARVMVVRTPDGAWLADPGFTFEEWVRGDTPLTRPTEDDLAYHLTTLFPPVRPRSWFELRYLDALPDGIWQVAAGVTTALIEDDVAADAATDVAQSVAGLTPVAMRDAVGDPRLRRAALRCLELAAEALPRLTAAVMVPEVERFREHYTERGRCPADDLLEPNREPFEASTPHGRHPLWP